MLSIQVQLFPTTNMMFKDNHALRLGGAIGVDNIRVEEDLARILNFNCFLQYNVGKEDEFFPSKWEVNLVNYVPMSGFKLIFRVVFHLITTQHPRDVPCMLKISVGVHPHLVVIITQIPLYTRCHFLISEVSLRIQVLIIPGVCNFI